MMSYCLLLTSLNYFLSVIWLPHSQIWAIIEGDSLTHAMLIPSFYKFLAQWSPGALQKGCFHKYGQCLVQFEPEIF